jgi:NADPH-dependent ferric siderophore reductase
MNDFGFALRRLGPGSGRTLRVWRLTVRENREVTPRVRRLSFTAPDLGEMAWRPGQDLVLNLPDAPRRHYTIRGLAGGEVAIDFVLHGHGAAGKWAETAAPGDRIEALGPRGRTHLTDGGDWRLFVGDETAVPAIAAMAEALPSGARAFALLEIETESERQPVATLGDLAIEWIVRGGPARPNDLLLDALRRFTPPPGDGHAYLLGETSAVRSQRHFLLERGWPKERITAEGYWRPGRIGGHDHV